MKEHRLLIPAEFVELRVQSLYRRSPIRAVSAIGGTKLELTSAGPFQLSIVREKTVDGVRGLTAKIYLSRARRAK
jgi:hypothetical protein